MTPSVSLRAGEPPRPGPTAPTGTRRLPSGSLMTYIAAPLYPVFTVEEKHHIERHAGVPAEHVDKCGPLPRRDRREGVREELMAPQSVRLDMKITREMRQALLIQRPELRTVRLPLSGPVFDQPAV